MAGAGLGTEVVRGEAARDARVGPARSRWIPFVALAAPFAGFVAAVALLWGHGVGPLDLGLLGVMYVVSGLGVTAGFHRLFTHRSFACSRGVEYALAIAGEMAAFGPVIDWVADHRAHHANTDRDGDPHSPHTEGRGTVAGLWHAHAGWLFKTKGRVDHARLAPDLLDDPVMVRINRAFPWIVLLGLAIPAAGGGLISGTWTGALTGLLWGGLARIFLFHHAILGVNSFGHAYGRRRFASDDRSTNIAFLSVVSLGESWHHNHHAFPRSAHHGLRWFELDPSSLFIRALATLGLARNVVSISPERQRERLAEPTT